jgi:histidyl-tRNA synthetase
MELRKMSEQVAMFLRLQGLKVVTPLEAGGFGAQLKLATKHGARFAVLLGETELAQGKLILKDLLKGEQTLHTIEELPAAISKASNNA